MTTDAPARPQIILTFDIAGPYDAKSIRAFMSAQSTATGVRLTFSGPISRAIAAAATQIGFPGTSSNDTPNVE